MKFKSALSWTYKLNEKLWSMKYQHPTITAVLRRNVNKKPGQVYSDGSLIPLC
jgi:hypothetical protein